MYTQRFEDGQHLGAIYFNDEKQTYFKVGEADCIDIIVVMENGQMAPVAWAQVFMSPDSGYPDSKWNLAHMVGVGLKKEEN